MTILIITLEIITLCEIACIMKWRKALEKREKAMQKAEAILAGIAKAQYEQVKATQHLLNTQKHKNLVLNQCARELEITMEEVKGIAGGFERYDKRSKRRK